MIRSVSVEQAAATWAYATAWTGLVALGRLAAGQTVLVPAASSSVALAAIQIANHLGARSIVLTRTEVKTNELRALGAAAVVATEERVLPSEIKRLTDGRGAELAFDPVGGPALAKLAEATASGGLLILYGALSRDPPTLPPFPILARNLTNRAITLPAFTAADTQLAAVKRCVTEGLADGSLSPTNSRTFPFDEIVEARRFVEAGSQAGKIVVTV